MMHPSRQAYVEEEEVVVEEVSCIRPVTRFGSKHQLLAIVFHNEAALPASIFTVFFS
jgi:hypothetical protein